MKLKILSTTLLIILAMNCVSAATITVDGNNSNFSSIQGAINSAQENDSILIQKGDYSETLTIDKQLKISSISRNPEDVIINPGISSRPIIHVTSDNVEITGLTIHGNNNKNQTSGIYLDNVRNSLIQNNIISNVQDGIFLKASAENNIKNNILLSNNQHGIYLTGSVNNYLRNNFIIDNKRGLYSDFSNRNTLADNNASNNEKYGIALLNSNNNNLTNNKILMNKYGLCLTNSKENVITHNIASNNKQSGFLLFWESNYNNVEGNVLRENENSGIYLISCSNNTFNRNNLSNDTNGISIEIANDNLIINNTFGSNKEYGIFYPHSSSNNIIKENIFSKNKKGNDNLSSRPIYVILILLTGTGFAYYLKKKSLLKKALLGLSILIAISLIAIVAWYFPFEADIPGNNVEINNLSWYNSSMINGTHTQVTLSMDINYSYKKAYGNYFDENSQTDIIPTTVQISSAKYTPNVVIDTGDTGTPYTLLSEEKINLTYRKPFKYETTFNLKNNMKHDIQVLVMYKQEYDYPNADGKESIWKQLGAGQQLIST